MTRPGPDPQSTIMAHVVGSLAGREPGPPSSAADPTVRQAAVTAFGSTASDWAAETAEATAALVIARYPRRRMNAGALRGLAEELLLTMLLGLVGQSAPAGSRAATQRLLLRDAVADGVPLDRVVATVRAIQAQWTGAILTHAAAMGARQDVQQQIILAVTQQIDRFLDAQVTDYLAEERAGQVSPHSRRRRLVDELVRGHTVEPAVARADLGIALDDHHLAMVLNTADLTPAGLDALQVGATRAGEAVQGNSLVIHEAAKGALWMWVSGRRPPDHAAARSIRLGGDDLRLGIGTAHPGATGFRRSHLEASDAERMARLGGLGPVVQHHEVSLAVLLQRDPERSRWFADTQLGALAEPANQVLRDTLLCYQRSQMRLATAAAALGVHRNTLIARLRRIEELLGHPIGERLAEVSCALLILDRTASSGIGQQIP